MFTACQALLPLLKSLPVVSQPALKLLLLHVHGSPHYYSQNRLLDTQVIINVCVLLKAYYHPSCASSTTSQHFRVPEKNLLISTAIKCGEKKTKNTKKKQFNCVGFDRQSLGEARTFLLFFCVVIRIVEHNGLIHRRRTLLHCYLQLVHKDA